MAWYLNKSYVSGGQNIVRRSCNCWRSQNSLILSVKAESVWSAVAWTVFMFCLCSGVITEWSILIRMAMCNADVLWNHVQQRIPTLADSTRQVPGYQELFFIFRCHLKQSFKLNQCFLRKFSHWIYSLCKVVRMGTLLHRWGDWQV